MKENELTFEITRKANINVSFSTKLRSCLNWSCLNYLVNAGLCDRSHITEVDSRPESKMMTECNVVWKVLLHPVKLMNFNAPLKSLCSLHSTAQQFGFDCPVIYITLLVHVQHAYTIFLDSSWKQQYLHSLFPCSPLHWLTLSWDKGSLFCYPGVVICVTILSYAQSPLNMKPQKEAQKKRIIIHTDLVLAWVAPL